MASSSLTAQERSISSPKLYDAFISHRGPDVKYTLAKNLYDLLKARECKVFLDREEIEGGDSIPFAIKNGICSSHVQIAIFSKGYVESSWCLDELLLMLQQSKALFIPVFYDVQPGELRHINNKSQYAAAFSEYRSKGRNLDKLDEWEKALASAADISGYERSEHQDNLCEKIVSRVLQVVQQMKNRIPLDVAKYPVGLAELVQDFQRSCSTTERDKVTIVGVFGLGGSGKTTLAKELFNGKRSDYHASCFLSDVRESHGRGELHFLQSQLLKDLFPEEEQIENEEIEGLHIRSMHHGIGELKDRLERARHLHFLVILDDIDHEDQIDALLPEGMLGSGSLIIITTRDKSVLRGADFCYKMKGMDRDHAMELFYSHAFRGQDPPAAYEKLVKSFVEFCGGLPLSLKVLGAHLYGRDEHYWELELEKVKIIPPKDIMQRLKISFDGLDKEEKQIFIDIACYFNKKKLYHLKSKVITIWNASLWSAERALQTLQDKCLLELFVKWGDDIFEMHDHLRDLGREIADELGPPRLWRPELLSSMEAKGFKQILTEAKGRCFHSFWDSSLRREITYFIADTDLLWLETDKDRGIISKSIPSWIPLRKLHYLSVSYVKELWSTFKQHLQTNTQASFELRKLEIWHSPSLKKLPDLIEMFKHLEELKIGNSLEKTDTACLVQSLKQLRNVRSLLLWSTRGGFFRRNLDLSGGRDLSNLDSSTSSCMGSLETIYLSELQNISKLVISGDMCPRLRSLEVRWMENLEEMELTQLERLNTLIVYVCPKLERILGLSTLAGLRLFKLEQCTGLKSLPSLAHLCHLGEITIIKCPKLQRVTGVEKLPGLKSLGIEMPDNGYAWLQNYIYGLRRLPEKRTILSQKAIGEASANLNAKLFSKVIGTEAVFEIERGVNTLKIESSSTAITVYALLVRSFSVCLKFETEVVYSTPSKWNQLITIFLTHHDGEGTLEDVSIKKGYKATMKVGEEEKALTLLKRIVDRLYTQTMTVDDMETDVNKCLRQSGC